jgi:hypothetical protein
MTNFKNTKMCEQAPLKENKAMLYAVIVIKLET